MILDLVRRTAAARLASNRVATPILLVLWSRMHRLSARFASLVARIDAGTLRPPPPKGPSPARISPRSPRPRMPDGFAWLIRLVPETAVCGSQLQHLLSQPDMIALLDAEPRFGRMLRPLCRMLAIALPVRPPPPPPQSGSASPKPRKASAIPERQGRGEAPGAGLARWPSMPPREFSTQG